MSSVTMAVTESMQTELKSFSWVNWSELAREEALKKLIFENYMKTGKITDEEWKFCEEIDWHPVDELPLKESYKKELEKALKEKPIRVNSVSDIFKNVRN
ncbi:MAG: hypothetical protein V1734_01720 [Nanoarchaeota archaeon]|mgnify:CR=1 FL=1